MTFMRVKGESAKAYQAFCVYRDLGPTRSLSKVAHSLTKSRTLLADWSVKWGWVERAAAYDAEQERLAAAEEARVREAEIAKRIEAVEEMNRRHAQQAQVWQSALFLPVNALMQRLMEHPDEIKKLEGLDTSTLLKMAALHARALPGLVNIERLARGEPSEKAEVLSDVAHSGSVEVESHEPPADPERLAAVIAILRQAGALPLGGDTPD